MFEDYCKLVGVNVIYFLLVEPGFYKFGITGNIYTRLQTHARTLKFTEIIGIFECPSRQSSFRIEQKFKKYANNAGILVRKYEKTEIICTNEPQKYVEWFRREIREAIESLGTLTIMNRVDNAPRIPRVRPQFDIRNFRNSQHLLVKPVIIPKVKKMAIHAGKNTAIIVKPYQMNVKNDNTCPNCASTFRDLRDLKRHQNRKVPCFKITVCAVSENQCIHCNNIYSNKYNLAKHQKKCKLKNRKVAVLPDPNVRLVEQVRMMAEEQKRKDEEQRRKDEEQKRKDEEKDREMAELRAMIKDIMSRSIAPASLQVSSTMGL